MPMTIVEEGRLCVDCVQIAANGEDGCEEACEHGSRLPAGTVVDLTEDNDSEFYAPFWPCRGCGTTLAGTWGSYAVLGRAS